MPPVMSKLLCQGPSDVLFSELLDKQPKKKKVAQPPKKSSKDKGKTTPQSSKKKGKKPLESKDAGGAPEESMKKKGERQARILRETGDRYPKERLFDVMDDIPPTFDGFDLSKENVANIIKSCRKYGMVVIHVANEVQCRENILEMWRNVILKQPWKEGYCIKLESTKDGRVLDVNNPDLISKLLSTVMTVPNLPKGSFRR